ncbi:Bacterial SH3 domain family [Synechococcus sp. PCC 7335]|uniref:SH3 domain-containing protein n=1 Tax=Synechococcus sp. (strain ATCC 29403 / PCC 7335) TaxID=91464 RepID=UPI00017EB130|nr:SH3 domain-containing protein [Synechococcus sp. PCC 7335]EDX87007.1 Bacterial SH3 domain family [Synechococcus sp. PCC 7335]
MALHTKKTFQTGLLSAIATGLVAGFGLMAKADTAAAHCDLYAPGEDYAYLSSNCTFSQRQGYIGIQLQANGVRYEFDPIGDQPGNYIDQHGNPVYRQAGLGDAGNIFEFVDGSHLYLYWDSSSSYGSTSSASGDRVGTLVAHERGSQINLRSEPTIYSRALGYGLAGDQIDILNCEQDTDTATSDLNWCRVQFLESGAIGWIRSDFIIFPSDGRL